MKRYLLFLFCLISFIACRSDATEKDGTNGASNNNTGQLAVTGDWVHEEYYAILKHHKSPRRAQKSCEMCLVSIPGRLNQPVEVVLNFHEAMENVIITKEQDQFQIWETNNNEPTRMIDSIQILSNGKIKIGDHKFINLKSDNSKMGYRILEQLLFKGAYITEEGDEIEFTNEGEVTGLGEYKYYEPVIDYLDVARDVDQIKLGKTKKEMEVFAFKFKKKKFQIFALDCKTKDEEGNCEEVRFGDLVFNLKKAK